MSFDPRLTPARSDLAAAHLRGVVEAARFAEATMMQVSAAIAPLRAQPTPVAMQETQLQFGEAFAVYDEKDGWAWGQATLDGYVGYVEIDALSAPVIAPTHRVAALRTYVFSEADIKSAPYFLLSLNAQVTVATEQGRLSKIARSGWVPSDHLRPLEAHAIDWVAEAERFLHAPYQWGGKESLGLDCSGLIQSAMHAAGRPCPRDSDMQRNQVGAHIAPELSGLQRGDLLCWQGHIGVMIDGLRLLHANGHHMAVVIEPAADAVARIAATGTPLKAIKRVGV
jgi:cell wall-associated NlpC family hydrolase